jgi:hypothetical protein
MTNFDAINASGVVDLVGSKCSFLIFLVEWLRHYGFPKNIKTGQSRVSLLCSNTRTRLRMLKHMMMI